MTQELKQRAREAIEQLAALDASKKPGGGVHGQVIGCEPWVIRTNGFCLNCLFEAQSLLNELLDPFDQRRATPSTSPASDAELPDLPTLPQSLLNAVSDYGIARTDGKSDVERLHLWQCLISGIKHYAADFARAASTRTASEPETDQLVGAMYALRHIASGGDDPAKCAQSALDVIARLEGSRTASDTRTAALAEAARLCDAADKSEHPADLADRIRALAAGEAECDAALGRAAPASQHDASAGESLDEKALNTLLWFYRRMQNSYGRLPFAEEAIAGLRERIAASRGAAQGRITQTESFAVELGRESIAARTQADVGKDSARLNALIDWYRRGGARSEINPSGHISFTTREQIIAWCDAQSPTTKPEKT